MNEALASNRSLKAASARLREAQQETIIARARRLPTLGIDTRGGATDGANISRSQSYNLNLAAS